MAGGYASSPPSLKTSQTSNSRVGSEDHGLTYFPNAGLHDLGHNGVYR